MANHAGKGSRGRTSHRWLRRLHRWAGLASFVFVLLLVVTGIGLNHASEWRLDDRRLRLNWLLDWYGIEAPGPAASHLAGRHRVTLLGGHLYLDAHEIAPDVASLIGAVPAGRFLAVATDRAVLLVTNDGRLVERIDLGSDLPAGIDAIGAADGRILFRSGDRIFESDLDLLQVEARGAAPKIIAWSERSPVPAGELRVLRRLYRGSGVSVERVLADLHSGRFLGPTGPYLVDLAAVIFALLAVTGLIMWARGPRKR
jgi:hypothetical protein